MDLPAGILVVKETAAQQPGGQGSGSALKSFWLGDSADPVNIGDFHDGQPLREGDSPTRGAAEPLQ